MLKNVRKEKEKEMNPMMKKKLIDLEKRNHMNYLTPNLKRSMKEDV